MWPTLVDSTHTCRQFLLFCVCCVMLPFTSCYLLLSLPPTLLLLVWGGGVVTWEDEIRDGPLTFILILKSCGVGWWSPWPSSLLLHSLPLTCSHLLLIPSSYSTFLPILLLTPLNSSYLLPKDLRWLISSYMKRFQCYSAQKSFMGGWWSRSLRDLR